MNSDLLPISELMQMEHLGLLAESETNDGMMFLQDLGNLVATPPGGPKTTALAKKLLTLDLLQQHATTD